MPASAPSPPVFGFPGVMTDRMLRATADVWVPCDEFAAAGAALAYTMLTGAPARLIVMAGTGTDLVHPILEAR